MENLCVLNEFEEEKKEDGLRGWIGGENTKTRKQRGSAFDDKFHMSESSALPPSISLSTRRQELVVPGDREREGETM